MSRIEQHWYRPVWWLMALLAPLEGLFALLAGLRRTLYRCGLLKRERIGVPLVVVGNINVGGVGKTPLTLTLLEQLAARGIRAGVISRGYGSSAREPRPVLADSTPAEVGDEPLLLAASGAPVWVGRDRVAVARALLAAHPEVQLLLSDDGLQHYRLARDFELVVLDGARGLGNGHLLPNGPLREPPRRLLSVNALVVNGDTSLELPVQIPQFGMRLVPGALYRLDAPSVRCGAADLAGKRVVALAGIGHPERFFNTLRALGIELAATLSFPDHHAFGAADLPEDADALIVTAKDAVKLRGINHARLWVLPVTAELTPDLTGHLLAQLSLPHGRKTA